ncbi:MAG TPA: dihydrodipicolinate reductase C-terminal domain-containing protein, partial [Gemmatimonadaceae bacterium]|nr:dihydrodipicolinate reductase C-terminal domain-containing protein [Gemmatimonadaceae bacterium]
MSGRRIAIIGDGQMGRAIESLARQDGWDVVAVIGEKESNGGKGITATSLRNAEVAVEFTEPAAAVANVIAALKAKIPVVVGTTGWYDSLQQVARVADDAGTALLWSANFSIGVNLFLQLAVTAGHLLRSAEGFDAHIVESHHTKKKDAPSGTALSIGKAMGEVRGKPVPITSVRVGAVPGTHEVVIDGAFEQISLTHVARDRRVFAEGALHAASWL